MSGAGSFYGDNPNARKEFSMTPDNPVSTARLAELIENHLAMLRNRDVLSEGTVRNLEDECLVFGEVVAARLKLAEVERDAARYRWLRARWGQFATLYRDVRDGEPDGTVEAIAIFSTPLQEPPNHETMCASLDAAVDAASEKEKPKSSESVAKGTPDAEGAG